MGVVKHLFHFQDLGRTLKDASFDSVWPFSRKRHNLRGHQHRQMSQWMQISIKWDRIIKENSLPRISRFLTQEAERVLGWILVPVRVWTPQAELRDLSISIAQSR